MFTINSPVVQFRMMILRSQPVCWRISERVALFQSKGTNGIADAVVHPIHQPALIDIDHFIEKYRVRETQCVFPGAHPFFQFTGSKYRLLLKVNSSLFR